MKQSLAAALALSFILVLPGCSDENTEHSNSDAGTSPTQNTEAAPASPTIEKMADDVILNAKAIKTEDGRVIVTGETNLPTDTELMISLSNEATGFFAQDTTAVVAGKYQAGPLGAKSGLTDGLYEIEITMPVPAVQPKSVQAAIGEQGEYLFGPLIKDSEWLGKIVEQKIDYMVGTQETIQQAQSEHDELVSEVRTSVEVLLKSGREMEKLRTSGSLSDVKSCGELMRANQQKAGEIREKAEALPMKYFPLKVAATDIYLCVSCSRTAASQACDRVDESLDRLDEQ